MSDIYTFFSFLWSGTSTKKRRRGKHLWPHGYLLRYLGGIHGWTDGRTDGRGAVWRWLLWILFFFFFLETLQHWLVCYQRETWDVRANVIEQLMEALNSESRALGLELEALKSETKALKLGLKAYICANKALPEEN